jgi:hypothetical protein
MSALTQQAREARQRYSTRPVPFEGKIGQVLARPSEGLNAQTIQDLLGGIRQDQQRVNDRSLRSIQRQFNSTLDPYSGAEKFNRKSEADLARSLTEAGGDLRTMGQGFGRLEQTRNDQIAKALRSLQQNRLDRRDAYLGTLEQFGNQRHALNNMQSQIDRNRFEDENMAPQRRMKSLAEVLEKTRGAMTPVMEGGHPDIERGGAEELIRALRAYGVDPSLPPDQWDRARREPAKYQGELLAPITPAMQASHDIAGRLDPALKDSYSPQRKQIINDLMGRQNITGQALQNLPEALRGPLAQLDQRLKEGRKKSIQEINNKYIKIGNYGSSQHKKDLEERVNQLNREALEERTRLLQGTLGREFRGQHERDIGNIGRLDLLGTQGQREFGNLITDVRNLNQLGAVQWNNNQNENEELYKNYMNQSSWEWPHLRNSARNEGIGTGRQEALGEVFRGLVDRNISLDNLAALNTRHSELERERNQYHQDLLNAQQARDALQRQIATSAAEQQRIAAQRQAEAEAERQRQAQAAQAEQARQAEAERLRQLQAQQAAEAAEAERRRQEASNPTALRASILDLARRRELVKRATGQTFSNSEFNSLDREIGRLIGVLYANNSAGGTRANQEAWMGTGEFPWRTTYNM